MTQEPLVLVPRGEIILTIRENGRIVDEVRKSNVVTDVGRRAPVAGNTGLGSLYCFLAPSSEAPAVTRYAIVDDDGSSATSGSGVTPSFDWNALTKSWFFTFSAPAATRRVGTVGISARLTDVGRCGVYGIVAYTTLSPVKYQTTLQTLELNYRLIYTPTY